MRNTDDVFVKKTKRGELDLKFLFHIQLLWSDAYFL